MKTNASDIYEYSTLTSFMILETKMILIYLQMIDDI